MYGLKLNLLNFLSLIPNVSNTACIVPGHLGSVNVLNAIIEFSGHGIIASLLRFLGSIN